MALKDKAAKIDFSNIDTAVTSRGQGAKTAIGMHADALFRDEKVSAENLTLKHRLEEFDGAIPTRRIDPTKIKASRWANRHEESFSNAEFEQLKGEIESAGGNVQPVKVRPLSGRVGEYELIFGHRRHRACLELGLGVMAVIENMDDVELFCQMDRENRERASLRPYEAGVMYARALDEGLFPSARKLAESAAIDLSQLGKALALARLPSDVLDAFPSPLDLQYRWVSELTQAIQKDPDVVLAIAKSIKDEQQQLTAVQVFKRLTGGGGTVPPPPVNKIPLNGRNGQIASISMNSESRSVEVKLKNIDPKRFKEIQKAIQALIS
jgi:ParB family chromosome partitioning protein